MNSADIQVIVSICAMLITIGTAIWSWITAGSRKNEKQIQQLIEISADQSKRIDHLENTLAHLPDRDAVHRIELALEKMGSGLGILTERVKPIAETTNRLNELLLDQARKSL